MCRFYFSQETIAKAVHEQSVTKTESNSLVASFVDGLVSIRAMKKQNYMFAKYYAAMDHYSNTVFTYQMVKQWLALYSHLLCWFGLVSSFILLLNQHNETHEFLIPAALRATCTMHLSYPLLCVRYLSVKELLVGG